MSYSKHENQAINNIYSSHSLLDARITSVLTMCHDVRVLSAVMHIVHNTSMQQHLQHQQLIGADSQGAQMDGVAAIQQTQGLSSDERQNITFLQAYGFGGLWRFAGPFLSRSSSAAAITAEVCSCMERLVASVGNVPPTTPPPRLPLSPVFKSWQS